MLANAVIYLSFFPVIFFCAVLSLSIKEFKPVYGILACVLGLVALIPIEIIQFTINSNVNFTLASMQLLLKCLLVNGLVEETAKMAVLFALPAKKLNKASFFWCAALSGLALGCYELFIYLVLNLHFQNALLRFLTAVIIHTACSALSGLFVYSVKAKKFSPFPFICAILFHGIYDYFAGFPKNTVFFYFSFIVIIFALIECRAIYFDKPEE
ncbi:PrsW family glutamic-type intramembrane protease [Treponema sp.]|uniref:PrsW family glutamic-type intramembrane protease n=1 Tax=Treponema sp. TaxID=166 RepID=UPI0025EE90DB|nr:PrsW family glutamic-type intramembrane protease [Treponema sp.]MCR5217802.1 PrsW family intramembrane metalloprotease [Treponema sp.]